MKVACVLYYAFLGVLRYLNKACVFFCAKYLDKEIMMIIIINCPDNLNYYTTCHTSKNHAKLWLMHAKVFERESKTNNEHTVAVLCPRHDFILLHHFFLIFLYFN